MGGSKFIRLLCGRSKSDRRIELDFVSVSGSELTWFSVGVEQCFLLVSGSKFSWFLGRGIEVDLILERGSE